MRRLLYLEFKRVVTARSVWITLVFMMLLSAVMAYFPISFESFYQTDGQGNVRELSGKESIDCQKQIEKEINGEITEEKLREAILVFQECYREYGAIFPPDVPIEVYAQRIQPIYPVLKAAADVLTSEDVSIYTMTDADITPDDAPKFYERYQDRMASKGKGEAEQEKIRELNQDVEMPFTYASGFSMTSLEYLSLYILLMLLSFIVIISPIFSAEYQTGADSILRCTRYGRIHLAVAKIVTAILIFAVRQIQDMQGGFLTVKNKKILAKLALPVCGILSEQGVRDTALGLKAVRSSLEELGYRHSNPVMSLGTLGLPVSPALKLTDRGLVDVKRSEVVPLIVE